LFQKIGFIGLGLIGGSIAKKIHTLYPDVTIIATAGHQETITEAYGEHLISRIYVRSKIFMTAIIFFCAHR